MKIYCMGRFGMNAYIGVAIKSFKQSYTYRANTFLVIIGNLLNAFITISVWQALYASRNNLNGITFNDMASYVLVSGLLSKLSYSSIALKVSTQVKDGTIANNLVRPISFKYLNVFDDFGSNIFGTIFTYTPTIIIFTMVYKIAFPQNLSMFFLFIISSILGICISYSMSFIYGMLTFWWQYSTYVNFLSAALMRLFAGSFIPLWFYPDILYKVSTVLPFRLIAFEPLSIYLGKTGINAAVYVIIAQIVWLIVLGVVQKLMWRGVQNYIVVQGG